MSAFLWRHRVHKLDDIVSKNPIWENVFTPFPQSLKNIRIISGGPTDLPRKCYSCETSLKKLKQCALSRERTSGNEALLERMCSPSINKQKPFHLLRIGGGWKVWEREREQGRICGTFLFTTFPGPCPLPAWCQPGDVKNTGMYTFPTGAFEPEVWPFVLPPFTIKITQRLSVIFNSHQRPLYNMAASREH